jgi:hypothetical protein
MAFTGTTTWYTSSNKYTSVAAWAAGTTYSVGDIRRPSNQSSAYTVTVANPGVFTWKDNGGTALTHNFVAGTDTVVFSGGSAPGGFTNGTVYYVVAGGLTASAFELALTPGGTAIQCTGAPVTNIANACHVGNERVHVCIAAGTSAASLEPVWTFTRGVKTTDNTVTWQEITGISTMNGDMTNTPIWTTVKNTSVTLGHVIKSNDGTKILIASTAGTAGNGAEPTWSTTLGGTTADNTVTWTTLKISSNVFSNWAAPHNRIQCVTAANWGGTIGNTFFLGNNHNPSTQGATFAAFTSGGGTSTIIAPTRVLSVNEAGSMPPVSADLLAGATESVIGGAIDFGFFGYCYGLSLINNATAGNLEIRLSSTNFSEMLLDTCTFNFAGNDSAGGIGCNGDFGHATFRDCKFRFGNASQVIYLSGWTDFLNCTFADTGTVPTTLFGQDGLGQGTGVVMSVIGCDLSQITGTIFKLLSSRTSVLIEGCKTNAALTAMFGQSIVSPSRQYALAARCGPDNKRNRMWLSQFQGDIIPELTVVRTGGANDDVGYGWKATTTANINGNAILGGSFLRTPYFGRFNTVTGASKTVTAHGLIFAASLPTNFDLQLDVQYPSDASSPILSRVGSRVDVLATPTTLTGDTSASYDSVAAARQNTHGYVIGDLIKTASSPGLIYICTTNGTSSGSEPGGYTGTADGASITDGTAVFRACNRFKVTSPSFTPNSVGVIQARWNIYTVSTTFYFDPYITVA